MEVTYFTKGLVDHQICVHVFGILPFGSHQHYAMERPSLQNVEKSESILLVF